MSKLELQKTAAGYTVATVGNLSAFEGKEFVKDIMGTTSMEVSFGSLAAGQAVPFLHHHKQNEELYVVLSGEGFILLDGQEITVGSGSVARVDPQVSRGMKNTGEVPMVYLCIQAKKGSLEQYAMSDGIVEE